MTTALVVLLAVIVISQLGPRVARRVRSRRSASVERRLEQLRIQHTQFIAEQRLQQLTQDALGQMLDERRRQS